MYQLRYIYTAYLGAVWMLLYTNEKFTVENWYNFFCHKVSFSTGIYSQFYT